MILRAPNACGGLRVHRRDGKQPQFASTFRIPQRPTWAHGDHGWPAALCAPLSARVVACSSTGAGSSSSAATQTATSHWWHKDADLWIEVRDAAAFEREVRRSTTPVIVDWYASWCTGCKKSYPEVCKVLRLNPDLLGAFKFVKICVDDFPKAFAKENGVMALPRMSLFRPGQGRVLTWDVPFSRVKHLKQNLKTIIANPDAALALDPNNFIIPVGPAPSPDLAKQEAARKAAAVAELESKSGNLFERLRAIASTGSTVSVASSTDGPPAAAGPAPAAPTAPTAVDGGNGAARGGQVVAPMHAPPAQAAPVDLTQQYIRLFGQVYALDKQIFLKNAGAEYGYGGRIDTLYPVEVGTRLAPQPPSTAPQHYLDYTGSSVYTQSQLRAVFEELGSGMFGNPHSANPSSELSTERIEEVRSMVLRFFNADPAAWQLVFTRSATGALKLVGETFPWTEGSLFRYLRENHNSVLGIREYALQHGAAFQAVDEKLVDAWVRSPTPPMLLPDGRPACKHDHAPSLCTGINSDGECEPIWSVDETPAPPFGSPASLARLGAAGGARPPPMASLASMASIDGATSGGEDPATYSLFAYPAEDNFAGVKYPLAWAAHIKRRSTADHRWMVLLDAAAYVPTQPLDLSKLQADFVTLSFYKMFGYPTGLGALLVRTEAVPLLRKVFWGGGSVALATSRDNFHVLKCKPSDKLEDGTIPFLDIIALKHGIRMMDSLGGIAKVQAHVACLTDWLYTALSKLRHSNGAPLLHIFGKHGQPNHHQVQGGIINFELLSPSGVTHSYRTFEKEAADAGFHVRTGAACNPGACYASLGIPEREIEGLAGQKEGCDDGVEFISVPMPDSPGPPEAVHSNDTLRLLSSTQRIALGHPAEVATKWVQVPLGSVRISLGWMSTFEDCWCVVRFIQRTYTNREAPPPTAATTPA